MMQILREHTFPSKQHFQIVQGDITQERVDAIVNAANARLQHGGGVAAAIVRRGGQEIQTESNQWVREHGQLSHAEPAYTTGGRLPCKYVIHAVGPIWGSGDEDNKLATAITGSLRLANKLDLESIAFPAISTGIFGFPKKRAAKVIFEAIKQYFLDNSTSSITLTHLVIYDRSTMKPFLEIWDSLPH
ncbi:MAG: macro domain-containing protein [Chloroflexota bacterium]|nr:macro domain-containing protein [Chloroflexota bacterium]